jgi:DnaJ-class molecular chaperone
VPCLCFNARHRFKEIAEAYTVLSNAEKRAEYDDDVARERSMPNMSSPRGRTGDAQQADFESGFGGGGIDPYELYRAFFSAGLSPGGRGGGGGGGFGGGGGGGFGGGGGGGGFGGAGPAFGPSTPKVSKPPLVSYALTLSLEELHAGCAKKLKVTRRRAGALETKLLSVAVKPGWKAGTKVTYQGEGDDAGPGTTAGDIQLMIAQKPHARFERVGDDLIAHTRVTLKDVISGREVEIPHLVEPPLRAKLSEVELDHGRHCIRFAGRGMPNTKLGKPGDAILVVHIAIPKRLTAEQRNAVCAALDSGA